MTNLQKVLSLETHSFPEEKTSFYFEQEILSWELDNTFFEKIITHCIFLFNIERNTLIDTFRSLLTFNSLIRHLLMYRTHYSDQRDSGNKYFQIDKHLSRNSNSIQ